MNSIQDLIKDGCEVKQLALSWNDKLKFVLTDDFSIRSIQYPDDILTYSKDIGETPTQKLDADFYIMSEALTGLFQSLLPLFVKGEKSENMEKSAKHASQEVDAVTA